MPINIVTDVPKDKVGETVQRFVKYDDPENVTCEPQTNGKWTVKAKLPD